MKVAKYVLAVLFILASFGAFKEVKIVAGIIFLVLGALFLPPVSEQIKEKFKLWQSKGIRYITYIALFLIGGSLIGKGMPNTIKSNSAAKEEGKAVETSKSNSNLEKVGEIEKSKEEMDNSDFWERYSPNVKSRIYELIKKKDCDGLQHEFNLADDNNQAQLNRTGRNNAELMNFIDDKMIELGCSRE